MRVCEGGEREEERGKNGKGGGRHKPDVVERGRK